MMLIERATEADFEAICAVDEAGAGSRSRRAFIAQALGQARVAVARSDGSVCGFVVVEQNFFGNGFVSLLMVHPEHRRRGVATALMRIAERDCPTAKLFTSTNESNVAMQRLCERLGYVRSGYIDNLDPGDREIVYFKNLAEVARPPADADDE
jgi:ribosomal protein S18 acetylase RimI-like enzyme